MPRLHVTALQTVITYVALVALTLLSFAASFASARLGLFDPVIALGIALFKTLLIGFFFMHLYEQRFANRFIPLLAILLVLILIVLIAADVLTRHTFPPAPQPPVDVTPEKMIGPTSH